MAAKDTPRNREIAEMFGKYHVLTVKAVPVLWTI